MYNYDDENKDSIIDKDDTTRFLEDLDDEYYSINKKDNKPIESYNTDEEDLDNDNLSENMSDSDFNNDSDFEYSEEIEIEDDDIKVVDVVQKVERVDVPEVDKVYQTSYK